MKSRRRNAANFKPIAEVENIGASTFAMTDELVIAFRFMGRTLFPTENIFDLDPAQFIVTDKWQIIKKVFKDY